MTLPGSVGPASRRQTPLWRLTVGALLGLGVAPAADAFILSDPNFQPWLTTASGARSGNGRPVTLTWSLIGDGTSTPGIDTPRVSSDFISFLDDAYDVPLAQQTSDLTQRPWFETVSQPFERWEAISGIDFVYEPNDDSAALGLASGQLGVRGDLRVGGRQIDGSGGTLAFAFLPSGSFSDGDVVFDTGDGPFFSNAAGDSLRLRNMLAHELGHSLGLEHVVSSTDGLLLEPSISLAFDGPQLDEVRAAHFFYGDALERSNNNQGNETAALATDLGRLSAGGALSIGADADVPNQRISADATDFVSISNLADTDFFSFTVEGPGLLNATLTPHGGQFTQGPEDGAPTPFDADSRSNLSLAIFDTDGAMLLATVDNAAAGLSDTLEGLGLTEGGEYFARVTGAVDTIQLYQLDLALIAATPGDFNIDGAVDTADYQLWLSTFGSTEALLADGNGNGVVDAADFTIWRDALGSAAVAPSVAAAAAAVPEPTALLLAVFTIATVVIRQPQLRPPSDSR